MPETFKRLEWDQAGEKIYELGIDQGVLFPFVNGAYTTGVAWSGLTKVAESNDGGESKWLRADNTKYANLRGEEDFKPTIEAFTYPDEFAACDGSAEPVPGVKIRQQKRQPFGLSYRTLIGEDEGGLEHGYKIHVAYGIHANPSDRDNETVNEDPDAITFSWECETKPVPVSGYRPVAHMEIDSTKVPAEKLRAFEDIIYGSASAASRLPLPDEIIAFFGETQTQTQTP